MNEKNVEFGYTQIKGDQNGLYYTTGHEQLILFMSYESINVTLYEKYVNLS